MTDPDLDPREVAAFARARDEVLARIAAAAAAGRPRPRRRDAGRGLQDRARRAVRAAVAAGLDVLGENRVQEAAAKIPEVPGARGTWSGPLQSNKARRAVELFDVIQTVDSLELARRLDRIAGEVRPGRPLPVLLQVNVGGRPGQGGLRGPMPSRPPCRRSSPCRTCAWTGS